MTKRVAPSDMDHLNPDRQDEFDSESDNPSKEFKWASEDVLRQRVIKVAKRSMVRQPEVKSGELNDTPMSIFNNFKGFQKSDGFAPSTGSTSNMFGFLSKIPHSQVDVVDGKNDNGRFGKIKSLNQSLANWIKMHVDKNPICDLNPILEDYKKYWNEIEEETSKKVEGVANEAKKVNFFSSPVSNQSPVSVNSAPFTFPTIKPTNADNEVKIDDNSDDDENPPEPQDNFDSIKEDGSVFHMKSKIYFMESGSFKEKGVGYVFLKPNNNKLQLIARMNNKLGTIIMNTVLTSSMPAVQKRNDTNVLLTCVPNAATSQTPIPVLFKVKNAAEVDRFINKLNENLQK